MHDQLPTPARGDGDPLVRLAVIIAVIVAYFGDPLAKLAAIIGLLIILATIRRSES